MDWLRGDLEIKSVDASQRIITAYAAVAGNLDRVGDIIDPGAFTKCLAEKRPTEVSVFEGHDTKRVPLGVCLGWSFDGKGLLTETKIFDGPYGDQVLGSTRGLMAVGRTLGASIGYRVPQGGSKMERVAGKLIRRLTDIDVVEYSFADSTAIANDQALVVGVKTRKAAEFQIEAQADGFHVRDLDDGDDLGTFDTREAAQTAIDALLQEENEPDDEDTGKTVKVAWTGAYVNDLPDSSFLYITPGGAKDDEGKTVPRSNRHFPYKDAEGKIDLPHLRNAIARIPQADVPNKDALQARAQRLLVEANDGKTLAWGAAWDDDTAALDVRAVAVALADLSEKIAAYQDHLAGAGLDVKAGRVLSNANLDQLHGAMQKLQQVHAACDMAGDCPLMSNGAKVAAYYRRRLALLAV